MVKIRRQHTSDLEGILIKYGWPHAHYGDCQDVLYKLVGHEVDPVPIPDFDDNDDVNDAIQEIAETQQTNFILICIIVGIPCLLIIAAIIACLCFKQQVVQGCNFIRRVTGG